MRAAATAEVFGGMGWRLLTETDPVVVAVIDRMVAAAIKTQEQRDKNLATLIGNAVGRSMGGKRGKR